MIKWKEGKAFWWISEYILQIITPCIWQRVTEHVGLDNIIFVQLHNTYVNVISIERYGDVELAKLGSFSY